MTAYRYCQLPTVLRLLSVIDYIVMLGLFINANQSVLAVLPIILLAPSVNLKMKHHRQVFYWLYPANLVVITLIKISIDHD